MERTRIETSLGGYRQSSGRLFVKRFIIKNIPYKKEKPITQVKLQFLGDFTWAINRTR